MPTITPIHASASTNGKAIKVSATASPGTSIHQATNTAGNFDDITLYAYNSDSADRELTLQWGGVATPDNDIKVTVPAKAGLFCVVSGLRLDGGQSVLAYCAAAANVITITAVVSRYAP
jgi:hypothetical protein